MSNEMGLGKHRVELLTDGIFAVVMTLLVLEISIPQISSSHDAIDNAAAGTELLNRLFDLWPRILSFGISFIILAIFWVSHHRLFHYIKHANRTLIWINFMFLMATCFLPFSSSLLGEYSQQQISIFVFGANSIMIASLLYIQWWYATSRHSRLVDENLDLIMKTTPRRRLVFGIIVYLIAIGISFVYIELSVFVFALILISAFMPNKIMHRMTFGALAERNSYSSSSSS
jgi:TMEM175 potassium channel family protein